MESEKGRDMSNISATAERFKVRVTRYWETSYGGRCWDGDFVSRVYAISGTQFLVYDNGEGSSTLEPNGFVWVDYLDMIPYCGNQNENMPRVELLDEESDQ